MTFWFLKQNQKLEFFYRLLVLTCWPITCYMLIQTDRKNSRVAVPWSGLVTLNSQGLREETFLVDVGIVG